MLSRPVLSRGQDLVLTNGCDNVCGVKNTVVYRCQSENNVESQIFVILCLRLLPFEIFKL